MNAGEFCIEIGVCKKGHKMIGAMIGESDKKSKDLEEDKAWKEAR